jgi:hypothetical protein
MMPVLYKCVLALALALASVINCDCKWHSSGLYYKIFAIVIYDGNDSGQYSKITIMIISYAPNLALAFSSVVNYYHKWWHNLEHHLLMMLEASFTIIMCL